MTTMNDIHTISPEALQGLGGGKLAYVKTIRSEDVQKHFPQAPELAPGVRAHRAASRRLPGRRPRPRSGRTRDRSAV